MAKSKFSLSTNKNDVKQGVSLDDVLDNPGKDLEEIQREKREGLQLPWEDQGVSKKERYNFLWSMSKVNHLKLEWIAEKTGYSKSRVLEDIVYPILDKKIEKLMNERV